MVQPSDTPQSRSSAPAAVDQNFPRSSSGSDRRARFGGSRTRNRNAFNFVRGWATALSNSAHLAARIAGESVERSAKFLSLPVQRGANENPDDSVFDSQLNSGEASRSARAPRATTVSAPTFGFETDLDFIDDQQQT